MWLLKNSQPRKSQKIKLRQETVQSIFSGRLDIFYPPSSASLRPKGSFSTPTGDFTQNRVVGEMTIFSNYAQLPPYRPSGADDSEVILHPPSATEPDCIRPSVYQIASGSRFYAVWVRAFQASNPPVRSAMSRNPARLRILVAIELR